MSLQVAYGHPPGPTPIAGRMAGLADYAPSLRSPWRVAFEEQMERPMDDAFLESLAMFNGHLFAAGLAPAVPSCRGEAE